MTGGSLRQAIEARVFWNGERKRTVMVRAGARPRAHHTWCLWTFIVVHAAHQILALEMFEEMHHRARLSALFLVSAICGIILLRTPPAGWGRHPLRACLRRGLALQEWVIQMAREVAAGMLYLHNHNIIHGDLNPGARALGGWLLRP